MKKHLLQRHEQSAGCSSAAGNLMHETQQGGR